MTPEVCPHCGADVPPGARACPECGSDEETGWSEEARYDNLNLPDENFDYDDFVKAEFAGERALPHGIHWFWWISAILVVGGLIYLWLL
jgi:zinc-ribbon domain